MEARSWWMVAERVGFEPTVLSHTAFRERHHQPLGHLSAREDTKELSLPRPADPSATEPSGLRGEQLLRLVAPDPADHPQPAPQGIVLRQLDDRAGCAVLAIGSREDE